METTRPIRFVATKSETGDLLFAEIEGDTDKVYVGQPLDLKLKIWLKPFRDRQRELVLSEGQMWQLLSAQTSWGSFSERLQELAENNQRPGGRAVLRDNGQGEQAEYYLYEIEATVYPTRPGRIDASDVQIVANYPTAIGKARDPFEEMFEGSGLSRSRFGGSSLLRQMMDDDFFASPFGNSPFGGSPFGSRLSVQSSRPIVADVTVDATEVLPVPEQGKPADYRGAVGRYRIVSEAEPSHVAAGDPITLRMGIVGDGPMELVQAPPLAEIDAVVQDFKVSDQSLAGFVRDDTKVFETTIRPRQAGIQEIPAIPFSFFNPDTEAFETVFSLPISITVDAAETLSLDAIVGQRRGTTPDSQSPQTKGSLTLAPDFQNDFSDSVLLSQTPAVDQTWYLWLVGGPLLLWLSLALGRRIHRWSPWLPSFRTPASRCRVAIGNAESAEGLSAALVAYIRSRTRSASVTDSAQAVGALRTRGLYSVANDLESTLVQWDRACFSAPGKLDLTRQQQRARQLVDDVERGLRESAQVRVRKRDGDKPGTRRGSRTRGSIVGLLALSLLSLLPTGELLAQQADLGETFDETSTGIAFTIPQKQTIFFEANDHYQQGQQLAPQDAAEARTRFADAASKYQLLMDSGIANAALFQNAGNACLQSGQPARAMVLYLRALKWKPGDRQLMANLAVARSRTAVAAQESPAPSTQTGSAGLGSFLTSLGDLNTAILGWVGFSAVVWILCMASLIFWGLMIARGFQLVRRPWTYAAWPLLLVVCLALGSLWLTVRSTGQPQAIVIVDQTTLRAGDGMQFDPVLDAVLPEGSQVEVLSRRGNWMQVRTSAGHTGWLTRDMAETI